MCVWKDENKLKRGWDWPIFNKKNSDCWCHQAIEVLKTMFVYYKINENVARSNFVCWSNFLLLNFLPRASRLFAISSSLWCYLGNAKKMFYHHRLTWKQKQDVKRMLKMFTKLMNPLATFDMFIQILKNTFNFSRCPHSSHVVCNAMYLST